MAAGTVWCNTDMKIVSFVYPTKDTIFNEVALEESDFTSSGGNAAVFILDTGRNIT